jgi:GT2 family glycosyltransferase
LDLEASNVTVVCITKRPWLGKRVLKPLKDFKLKLIDGNQANSFAELCNSALLSCDTDLIVICSDKCFPDAKTIMEIRGMLMAGYGLVCAYRFGCFGISTNAINRIGLFDERFVGGGYEDTDYLFRFHEQDVAVFETESIPYFPLPSLWKIAKSRDWFDKKWHIRSGQAPKRIAAEATPRPNFEENTKITLLPFSESRLCSESIQSGIKFF